jgi:hypothetical protein
MTPEGPAVFNGIDARTGAYLFEPMTARDIAQVARGHARTSQPDDEDHLHDLQLRKSRPMQRSVKAGIQAAQLEQAGWGVIFPATRPGSEAAREQAAIREALAPLLDLRRAQATKLREHYYREYHGPMGYRPGETKLDFMRRIGVGPGPADPDKVPYYLLLVGSPEAIPFRVQYQIDVQYAVGRIHFDTLEQYAAYARSVVAAERDGVSLPRELAFVGVANPDDEATRLSRGELVSPLAKITERWAKRHRWKVSRYFDDHANKGRVSELFGGSCTPALMFSASHGLGFDRDDPRQRRHQGALVLQDWPGPEQSRGRPIGEDMYFSCDDLRSDASLHGMIAFNFACYGGGTPRREQFGRRETITDEAFVAGLHRRMLSLANGGALAAIGHVDRVWSCSFMWRTGSRYALNPQLAVFESTLESLMEGNPVGVAMEYFNERYAELASDLGERLERELDDCDALEIANLWTSNNDARGYGILGDPAVRLRFADELASDPGEQPIVVTSTTPEDETTPEGLVSEVLRTLAKAAEATPPLEVRTYLVGDVETAAAGTPDRRLGALTRVSIDGNTEVFVAERDGAVDPELIELHLEMVKQAQQARRELVRAIVDKLDPDAPSSPSDPEEP